MELTRLARKKLEATPQGERTLRYLSRGQRRQTARSPIKIATDGLVKALQSFEVETGLQKAFSDDMATMEKARFMNMKVLAITYLFMYRKGINDELDLEKAGGEVFSAKNMDEYVSLVIPKQSDTEKKLSSNDIFIMKTELRDEVITYMYVILEHRQNRALYRNIERQIYEEQIPIEEDESDDSLGPDEEEED